MTLLGVHKLDKAETWTREEREEREEMEGGREGGLKALLQKTELLVLCPKGE